MNMTSFFRRIRGREDLPEAFDGDDRRSALRYDSAPNQARLFWQEGAVEHLTEARLENVGANGALVATADPPPIGQHVQFRLEVPEPTEWVEAEIVRIAGPNEVGLFFHGACPYEMFKTARQIGGGDRGGASVAGEFDERLWR